MVAPTIIPRPEHTISRRDIDSDALKVLYRLHRSGHVAYLVGGSVRDLLLGRRPKDFDIGTSAHPYEVKRLFRNCWIIGRRFRLAHVKFGPKTIEVATFRRHVPAGSEEEPPAAVPRPAPKSPPPDADAEQAAHRRDRLIHRDNTFGTAEEDAFRRDFTINALFYDIGTFSLIDYVDGLEDLHARLIRCIGDPTERFLEDPVRMLRAVALAARLDFSIDPPVRDAIAKHRQEIGQSAPARLLDELYKILRSGAAEATFRSMAEVGLLKAISPELSRRDVGPLRAALARLDAYRRRFDAIPDTLQNAVLLGSLLVPYGFTERRPAHEEPDARGRRPRPEVGLGMLPVARRDVDLLRQILGLQRRLIEGRWSPRALEAVRNRAAFAHALTWLEIHGESPELVEQYRRLGDPGSAEQEEQGPQRRPRRRRRRRSRSASSER